MLRPTLTRSRICVVILAAASFGFASCNHSSSTPATPATPTAVPTSSSIPTSACANADVAYEPDAGNGNGFHGIQTVQYENDDGFLCGSNLTSLPPSVTFASSVGTFDISADFTGALALLQNGSGGYSLGQDVSGAALGQLVPIGTPYNLSVTPSPAPSASPTSVPLISNGTSVAILSAITGTSPIALITGPSASAIVALTSLNNAPPQYGGAIPFSGNNYKIKPPPLPRSIVRVASNATSLIARGPSDLLVFSGQIVASGYQFDAVADDTTLGAGTLLSGRGNIAYDPPDPSRILVGGTSSGSGDVLTLVTGIPNSIVHTSVVTLPGNINSITIDSTGSYAYVSTSVGLVVVRGVSGNALSIVAPGFEPGSSGGVNALPYTNCNGVAAVLSYVSAARISTDNRYLVALGTQPGTSCPSGYDESVVAIPFNPASGSTPSPSPTPTPAPSTTPIPMPSSFVQNNVIAAPLGADNFIVH